MFDDLVNIRDYNKESNVLPFAKDIRGLHLRLI